MKQTFGELIQFYRMTRGSYGRQSQQWLGLQLDATNPKAASDLISQTEAGKRLLSRRQVLRFGALYGLNQNELDKLLEAARDHAKSPKKALEYVPLNRSEAEIPVFGPWDIPRWRDRVRIAIATNQQGNVDSAALIARDVLDEIASANSDADELGITWHADDRAESHDLWLRSWSEFAFAIEAIVPSDKLLKTARPYLRHADQIRYQLNQHQVALLDYTKADLLHCLVNIVPDVHRKATSLAKSAMPHLPNTWHRMGCQRVILLDGSEFLPSHHIERNVDETLAIIEAYKDSDHRGLAHGIEGLGQVLNRYTEFAKRIGFTGMDALRLTAQISDQHQYQLGHIMGMRSQMKALIHSSTGLDRDQFIEIGTRAISITRQRGWLRKSQQLEDLASLQGIHL